MEEIKMSQIVYFGTYTRQASQGIYKAELDESSAVLKNVQLLIPENNPTYLAIAKSGVIYCVTKDGDMGGIAAYKPIQDGSYELINNVLEKGAPPCYVAVDERRQLVYAANYHDGIILVYKIQPNGSIELVDRVVHKGSGPHPNQVSSHVHFTNLTPENRLVVCDLGTDEVTVYDVADEGKLTLQSIFNASPGTGPRHLVFHPKKNIAYLVGELTNTIHVLNYDANTSSFEEIQSLPTLPEDYDGESSGSAVRITSDGRFVYASNRGHDSISIFSVDEQSGQLSLVDIVKTEGSVPRDFALDNTEEFVVCGHQLSDHVTLFKRDTITGKLELLSTTTEVPESVCVVF